MREDSLNYPVPAVLFQLLLHKWQDNQSPRRLVNEFSFPTRKNMEGPV